MNEKTKNNLAIALAVCFGIVFLIVMNARNTYNYYYSPMYTLFPNSLYLPLFLYAAGWGFLGICSILAAVFLFRGEPFVRFLGFALGIGFLLFIGGSVCKDIQFACNEKYLMTTCHIETLHRYYSGAKRGRANYQINSIEAPDGKPIVIKMDAYQYQKLLKIRKRDANKTLTIYYLPNTARMLKYE